MFLAKALQGEHLQLLRDELDGDFVFEPDYGESFDNGEFEPFEEDMSENLLNLLQGRWIAVTEVVCISSKRKE